MAEARLQCYACNGLVHGADKCPSCGAEQTRTALALFRSERRLKATIERWRILTIATGLVCFTLGMGVGMWAAQPNNVPAPSSPAALFADLPENRALTYLNDVFMRSVDDALGLGLVSWTWGEDSTLVLEMQPPSPQQPNVLWQALTSEERRQVLGFLGVEYTRVRLASGLPYDLATRGHPPVALRYRSHPTWLALRQRDGSLHIFPSPYDSGPTNTSSPTLTPPSSR